MKKYLFFILVCFCALASCHQPKIEAVASKWTDYRKGYTFLNHHKDSAFYYFNKVAEQSKDSQQVATAYSVMAGIQYDTGDYFGAQENLANSLRYLDPHLVKNYYVLAETYNELGLASTNLKRYPEAISFFNHGLNFCGDTVSQSILLNNKGDAYQKKGDYDGALSFYDLSKRLTRNNTVYYAQVLTNIAVTNWLKNKNYNAAPNLLKALKIRVQKKDTTGENLSYSHLANFYYKTNRDSALFYTLKNISASKIAGNPDNRLEALSRMIALSAATETKQYFNRYQQLNDSLQTARNAAKNQFALIRYAAEKTEADNLKLQRDNDQKKYLIAKQNIILYSTLVLFIAFTIGASYWYRKRRQQAIQENQLRLSKKVHDVVANGLYQVMQEIDNEDEFEKEPIVDRLNLLYERSRDISHDEIMIKKDNFPEKIKRMIMVFAGPEINIAIVGNEDSLWLAANETVKSELEYILQELMVNMKKHSQATSVAVKFQLENNQLIITYTDNGIGLPAKIKYGHGLRNTENRIKVLNGYINFENNLNKGIRIRLNVPVA